MNALAGFWNTIILLSIVQGFILCGLLYFSSGQQTANRILAALIGIITLACLNIYLLDAAWINTHLVLQLLAGALPLVLIMPLGPLIWLYVQASLDTAFKLSRKHYLHFYPVSLDLLPYMTILLADIGLLAGGLSKGQRSWVGDLVDSYNVYADIPRWASVTFYCWLSRQYIAQHRLKQEAIAEATASWLQQFLLVFLVFQGIWLVYLVPYIIPATRQWLLDTVSWYPVFVPLAILVYWLGFKGYLVHYKGLREAGSKSNLAQVSRLPDTTAQQYIERLRQTMEAEKLFLDPSLQVGSLAQQAGIPAKSVSAVLNQHLNKSFSTFVNEYRVAAFKKRIMEAGTDLLTIPGIAMECGFSSPATFQRIFKQLTGTTPPSLFRRPGSPKACKTSSNPELSN
ncbi:helix-turn-helix domain-containing protein [Paraflavitalea speifideaquila]|uniref:helix-turn-helix domain-containing protein n=1 Tax=Paraflavitalea speifideaquila TaxID=3076558 RepID=UPI0028E1B90A|nr:helix-turn-helix domain-containing protein [Paraflavitalea speifideiaquila]